MNSAAEQTPPDEAPIRLAKRVAAQFSCSRSEAEHYIEGGWVSVDGEIVEAPMEKVRPAQIVTLAADASLSPFNPVSLIYHKPAGTAFGSDETASDAATVLREITAGNRLMQGQRPEPLLRRHLAQLKLPCPLDVAASGLVVLTQDFRVVRKLTEDAALIEQELIVECAQSRDTAPADLLTRLNRPGRVFLGKAVPACKVSWQNETRLRFAIKGPRPGLIAHLCAEAGVRVNAIRRIRIGRLPLAGLPVGQWRFLNAAEKF